MYAKADFDDEDTRNQVLEYFVDKIYVYNDRLVITWYYSDDKTSIDLDALTELQKHLNLTRQIGVRQGVSQSLCKPSN